MVEWHRSELDALNADVPPQDGKDVTATGILIVIIFNCPRVQINTLIS